VTAYLMDWANEDHLIDGFPNLRAYLDRMYTRSTAPQRIAEALASIRASA
jgi:glutathione S-transferase